MAGGYSWKRALAIVAVLIVALVLVSVVVGGRSLTVTHNIAGPTGTILISSATDPDSRFLFTYTIGVNDGSIVRMSADDFSGGTFYVFTRDASTIAFAGITDERLRQAVDHKDSPGQVTQIYRARVEKPHQVPNFGQSTQVTNGDAPIKFELALSDDGSRLLYVAASQSPASVASSTIHLVTADNDTTLTNGITPQWYSSAAFFYCVRRRSAFQYQHAHVNACPSDCRSGQL
jgi:hypothetical protein